MRITRRKLPLVRSLAGLLLTSLRLIGQTPATGQQPSLEPVQTTITVLGKISTETPANVTEVPAQDLALTPGPILTTACGRSRVSACSVARPARLRIRLSKEFRCVG